MQKGEKQSAPLVIDARFRASRLAPKEVAQPAYSPFQQSEEKHTSSLGKSDSWKKNFESWRESYFQQNKDKPTVVEEIRVTELLANLVSFPTVSSDGATLEYQAASEGFLRFVGDYLGKKGEELGFQFHTALYENNGVRSMVVSTHQTKHFDYLCLAHYDVVASFIEPHAEGGKLFGRGTSDMKPGVLVGMESLVELAKMAQEGKEIPSFGLILTGDEEIGSQNGAELLFKKHGYSGNVAIVFDGGMPGAMSAGSKGLLVENVVMHGVTVHGAYPYFAKGVNPVVDFWPKLKDQLENEYPMPEDETNRVVTLTPSMITSGHADNSTPAEMRVTFNCRFPTRQSLEEHNGHLRSILENIYEPARGRVKEKIAALEESLSNTAMSKEAREETENRVVQARGELSDLWFDISEALRGDVCEVDMNNPDNIRYRLTAQKIRGEEMPESYDQGTSDVRFLGDKVGTVILTAANGSAGKHESSEYADISKLLQEVETVKAFVREKPQSTISL